MALAVQKKQENDELAKYDEQVRKEIVQIQADFENNKRKVVKMLTD